MTLFSTYRDNIRRSHLTGNCARQYSLVDSNSISFLHYTFVRSFHFALSNAATPILPDVLDWSKRHCLSKKRVRKKETTIQSTSYMEYIHRWFITFSAYISWISVVPPPCSYIKRQIYFLVFFFVLVLCLCICICLLIVCIWFICILCLWSTKLWHLLKEKTLWRIELFCEFLFFDHRKKEARSTHRSDLIYVN